VSLRGPGAFEAQHLLMGSGVSVGARASEEAQAFEGAIPFRGPESLRRA
jgi:hypothetical protein